MTTQVVLPTFHTGQVAAWHARTRHFALCCGRRWGKTDFSKIIAGDAVTKGRRVGFFVPNYKFQTEVYRELDEMLLPIKHSGNKSEYSLRFKTGGLIDCWTLENETAGRGRKYDTIIVDESAFTKNGQMIDQWEKAISPTIFDTGGNAIIMSTPNGIDEDNFFYQACQGKNGRLKEFTPFFAPTHQNPLIPQRKPGESWTEYATRRLTEFQKFKAGRPPKVFQQEFLAEFVNWGGDAFFDPTKLLINGVPVATPQHVEYVAAIIDTAVKDGLEHDGTAVMYVAKNVYGLGPPMTVLDWDIIQIQGNMLETWLPTVYQNLNMWTERTKARYGSNGAFIEDKASGTILLQQALAHGWQAHPIESQLTSLGKDARAISVSGHYYQEKVKISDHAFNKTVNYKEETANHLLKQLSKFYIGDKDAAKRADDLTDCFTYGVAICLGNELGF